MNQVVCMPISHKLVYSVSLAYMQMGVYAKDGPDIQNKTNQKRQKKRIQVNPIEHYWAPPILVLWAAGNENQKLSFRYLTSNSVFTTGWSTQKLKHKFCMQCGSAVPSPASKLWTLVKLANHFENEFYHRKNLDNTSYRLIDSVQQALPDCFLRAKCEVVTEIGEKLIVMACGKQWRLRTRITGYFRCTLSMIEQCIQRDIWSPNRGWGQLETGKRSSSGLLLRPHSTSAESWRRRNSWSCS